MIEFEKQVDLRGASVSTAAVQVSGNRTSTCAGVPSDAGARAVVSVYTNSVPRRSATAAKGNYLIVELDQNDANSRAFRGGCPLQLNYSASWGDLHNRFGQIEVPAAAVSTTNQISPVVDDFIKDSYTSATTTLPYRLFQPEPYLRSPANPARKYPLMLFLHGGGERGDNNVGQIVANMGATVWASPEFQAEHPSFVLAPQCPLPADVNAFANPDIRDTVRELVLSLMAKYPIDPDRVYIQGLSMGAAGTIAQLNAYPEMWAGALVIAGGRPLNPGAPMQVPVWMATAFDDDAYANALLLQSSYLAAGMSLATASWPGNLFEAAAPFAEALIQVAESQGKHLLFTTYQTGTNVGAAHNTGWIATYSNPAIRDWLYDQKLP